MNNKNKKNICKNCHKQHQRLIEGLCLDCWVDLQYMIYKESYKSEHDYMCNSVAGIYDSASAKLSLGNGNFKTKIRR